MSFGRWLLIHSFSIFLVAVFLLGYLYREQLQLEQVYRQILKAPAHDESQPLARKPPRIVSAGQAEADSAPAKPGTLKQAAAEPDAGQERQVARQEAAPRAGSDARQAAAGDSSAAVAPRQPNEASPATALTSRPTVSSTVIEQSELLYQARKAYWDKDYDKAITHYHQLIEEDRDNADYPGESGNIYYSLNDFDNAAQQFYRAAMILIDQGRRDQASSLLSPVKAMNRDLGDRLRQRLRQQP